MRRAVLPSHSLKIVARRRLCENSPLNCERLIKPRLLNTGMSFLYWQTWENSVACQRVHCQDMNFRPPPHVPLCKPSTWQKFALNFFTSACRPLDTVYPPAPQAVRPATGRILGYLGVFWLSSFLWWLNTVTMHETDAIWFIFDKKFIIIIHIIILLLL